MRGWADIILHLQALKGYFRIKNQFMFVRLVAVMEIIYISYIDGAKKNKVNFICTGIDLKAECIETAKRDYNIENSTWLVQDYKTVIFKTKPDIIFSSLFCHHFIDEELVYQLRWMQQNASLGSFINDLQRNWFAYHSIKIITKFFSASYLVKNDAPLSVARGFHKNEWLQLLNKAGIKNYGVKWKWAFRYLIIYKHAN